MQRPDAAKRTAILDVAARLFHERPFHEVRLEDVAAEAQVGKGTLYIYFKDKDELYLSLIRDGFSKLIDRLTQDLEGDEEDPWKQLRAIIRQLVSFHKQRPQMFQVLRHGAQGKPDPIIRANRLALAKLIERVLTRGVRAGQMNDPRPNLTAQMIPGMVRSAMLFGPQDLTESALASHILRLLRRGLKKRGKE